MSESEEKFTLKLDKDWFGFKLMLLSWADMKGYRGLLDGVTPPHHQSPELAADAQSSNALVAYKKAKATMWFRLTYALTEHHGSVVRAVEFGDTVALWKRLLADFEPDSTVSIQFTLKNLLSVSQNDASVGTYLDSLKITRDQLKSAIAERKIDLLDVIMQLVTVQGLNMKYDPLKQNLFVRGDDLKYSELCDVIKSNCQRIDFERGDAPNMQTNSLYGLRQQPNGKSPCPHCASLGQTKYHEVSQCWAKYPSLKPVRNNTAQAAAAPAPNSNRPKDPNSKRSQKAAKKLAAAATAAGNTKSNKQVHTEENSDVFHAWLLHVENADDDAAAHTAHLLPHRAQTVEFEADSGAQCNYMPSPALLQNYKTANHGGHTIVCATGSRSVTEGAGNIGSILPKVYVNSKIVNNIMSVSAQFEQGRATLFHPKYGVVIANADDMQVSFSNPIATGGLRNGTFKVDVPLAPVVAAPVTAAPLKLQYAKATSTERLDAKCQLWLGRLGYAGPGRIVSLARDPDYKTGLPTDVKIESFHTDQNDVYQLAKSREQPHRNKNMKITATKPFEMIHIDCITEPVVGYNGKKYTLNITCDYSAWTHTVNLATRSEVPAALNTWIKTFVEPLHFKVDRIRMDNAGEQTGMTMAEFLVAQSIAPQYSSANSSASNGVVERSNQTLETLSRAMLIGAKLPTKAWPLTNDAAAFIKNRLPTRRNPGQMTPYERVYGRKPDLSALRTIGCKAYVHKFQPSGLKLDKRAVIGTMAGYDPHSHRYRILLDPQKGTTVLSANVTFAETVMNLAGSVRSLPGFSATHVFDDTDDDSTEPTGSGGNTTVPATANAAAPATATAVAQAAPLQLAPAAPREVVRAATPPGPQPPFITPPFDRYQHLNADTVPLPRPDDDEFDPFGDGEPPEDDQARVDINEGDAEEIEELLIQDLRVRLPRAAKAPVPLTFESNQIRNRGKYNKVMRPLHALKAAICNVRSTQTTFREAMIDPILREAARKELTDILTRRRLANGTWVAPMELVDTPAGANLIGSKWVFKKKYTQDMVFDRAKGRLTSKGFMQRPYRDYDPDNVASPTLMMESAMIMLSLQVNRNMDVLQIDFDSAFQNTAVDMPIYMRIPEGMIARPGQCLKLNNALQGTKQASYLFYDKCSKFLLSRHFKQSLTDPCVFMKWEKENLTAIAVYVDDLRAMADGPNGKEILEALYEDLKNCGPCKIADPTNWLGMKIEHDREAGTLKISMKKYIDEMLAEFGMTDCKPVKTPVAPGTKLVKTPDGEHDTAAHAFPYRSAVGGVLWPARTARPEILYSVNQCGAHSHNPGPSHVAAVKRVLRYLKGTSEMGITFRRNPTGEFRLKAFADADYAGEPEENDHPMRSLSGMIAYIHGVGPVYSKSKMQKTVARSTAESEYKSASVAAQIVSGLRNFLEGFGLKQVDATPIGGDNQAALAQLKNRLAGSKSRHVKVDFHYVKELVQQKEVEFYYTPTEEMVADIMTKALPIVQFEYLRDVLLNKM